MGEGWWRYITALGPSTRQALYERAARSRFGRGGCDSRRQTASASRPNRAFGRTSLSFTHDSRVISCAKALVVSRRRPHGGLSTSRVRPASDGFRREPHPSRLNGARALVARAVPGWLSGWL